MLMFSCQKCMMLKPREKAQLHGIDSLEDAELLALILKTGYKNNGVVKMSANILNNIGGYYNLWQCDYSLLTSIKGVGNAKALQLLALSEISKRSKEKKLIKISSPDDVLSLIDITNKQNEFAFSLILDKDHNVLRCTKIGCGTENIVSISRKDILKNFLAVNGHGVIIIHNHPSNSAFFSIEDKKWTENFKEYCMFLGINFVDHILLTQYKVISYLNKQSY